jgi:heme-degrading monooxygenase HmoA
MAVGRYPLRRVPGLRFARLLGTSKGRTFTATDADPLHWALLSCWDSPEQAAAFERTSYANGWDARSDERLRLELLPLSSTGRWSRKQPFGPEDQAADTTGPCAILTRARLVPGKAMTFRRAVPPVATSLTSAPGLRLARGIGEAPIGLQATFSVWDDLAAAKKFAYGNVDHRNVVRRTAEVGWYAEQLFARFAVVGASGEVDGRRVS